MALEYKVHKQGLDDWHSTISTYMYTHVVIPYFLRWRVRMNIMNSYVFVYYFCIVQRQQVLDILPCGQHLPILKKISHQQLTLVLRPLHVEFRHLIHILYASLYQQAVLPELALRSFTMGQPIREPS